LINVSICYLSRRIKGVICKFVINNLNSYVYRRLLHRFDTTINILQLNSPQNIRPQADTYRRLLFEAAPNGAQRSECGRVKRRRPSRRLSDRGDGHRFFTILVTVAGGPPARSVSRGEGRVGLYPRRGPTSSWSLTPAPVRGTDIDSRRLTQTFFPGSPLNIRISKVLKRRICATI